MNTELLQFLDGSLHPEQEAELLHRLSVSPERRDLLRSFINQQVIFQRDRNTISVPIAAEQKLWARLSELMPPMVENSSSSVVAIGESAAHVATQPGFFNSVYKVAALSLICLFIGIGSGFIVGHNLSTPQLAVRDSAMAVAPTSLASADLQNSKESSHLSADDKHFALLTSKNDARIQSSSISEAPLSNDLLHLQTAENGSALDHSAGGNAFAESANTVTSQISTVLPKTLPGPVGNSADVGDRSLYYPHSPFDPEENNLPEKTFLQRFEFYFNEGIGKQFPNNAATNISVPVVTNSSIATLFQLFPRAQSLWGGAAFGTANVTMKKFRIAQKDPLDPKAGYEMVGDLVHVQTTYGGPVLQYRVPEVFRKTAFTLTGTVAASSAGMIVGGEVGVHYDATSDVGFAVGLRGTHLSYNVDAQQQQVINQGVSSFGVPATAVTTQPSYNFEINGGFYFHF